MSYYSLTDADMFPIIVYAALGGLLLIAINLLGKTDIPKIKNLPELPGYPIFGSLFLLGKTHARSAARLAQQFGPVFQVRLGKRRIIYANTFESAKALWIGHQGALVSRARFWTFHSVVSATQGYTLGSSPWNESVKRTKKAAATALNRRAVQSYLPSIDLESATTINEFLADSGKNGQGGVDPTLYFQHLALNMSLTLTYGFRIWGKANDDLVREVIEVEKELSTIRGVANNWHDYVPLLRLWPGYRRNATSLRERRDKYILSFVEALKRRIAEGTDGPCIAGNCLKDADAKLDEGELKTICLTMVAAGLDTLPSNMSMAVAYLSSPHGQELQATAHAEITKAYPDGDAWEVCVRDERCAWMVAFVKEVLRYWSTVNMSFTRESVKEVVYQGATIPAGTPFFLNVYAANHDPTHFSHPDTFDPERFLHLPDDGVGGGTQHFAYGAGSRACSGMALANRELYVIFVRLILAFRIREAVEPKDRPVLDAIECNRIPTGMVTQPKAFRVVLEPREREVLVGKIGVSLEGKESFGGGVGLGGL